MKRALLIVLGSWLAACSASRSPDAGSQTHFLDSCSAHCAAPYSCICGVCTLECSDDTRCAAQADGATCASSAADGTTACEAIPSSCDVECERDAQCSSLGAGFGCQAGRCRAGAEPASQSNAGAGAGGTAGTGNPAGSGERAGSTAQGGEGGQGGSSNPDDPCADFNRSVTDLIGKHQDCEVDADCTIVGDCSGGFGFYAVNLAGSAEAHALSDATPARCAANDGPLYIAQCVQNECSAVATGGSCGQVQPTGPICDGSDEIRLALVISGGGPLQPSHAFTSPHGHAYLFIDGQCTFHVSGLDYQTGIRSATLPSNMEQQLAADIHWTELSDLQDTGPINGCPDGSPVTISALGFDVTCICDDCGMDAPAGKREAVQKGSEWIQMLSELGNELSDPVRALAILEESPRSGDPASWSLSRAITEIPGLIPPAGMQITAASGASFETSLDRDALRGLRDRQHSMYASQGFARVWMSVGEPVYELYVRNELSPEVDSAFTEFLNK